MKKIKNNSRGQLAIFVIVAIVLVAGIGLFIALRSGGKITLSGGEFKPESFIDSCIRGGFENKTLEILSHGGVLNPSDFVLYDNKQIAYLCKNVNHYEPCVNQHPLLISEMKEQLEDAIKDNVKACIETMKKEAEARNFAIETGEANIGLELKPDSAVLTIEVSVDVSKGEIKQHFDKFVIRDRSSLHNLGSIASEITRQEAQYCYFENLGYSLIYKRYDVKRDVLSDSTKIYTIRDKETEQTMSIAVRGCAIPAGL